MVTASLTTPAIVTVTALVTETRTNSVKTCNVKEIFSFFNDIILDQEKTQLTDINSTKSNLKIFGVRLYGFFFPPPQSV